MLPITEREAITAGLNELRIGTESVGHAFSSAPRSQGRALSRRGGYYGGYNDGYSMHGIYGPSSNPDDPACAVFLLFGGVEKYYKALLDTFYAEHAPRLAGRAAEHAAACARLDGNGRAELLHNIAAEHLVYEWRQPPLPGDNDTHSTGVLLSQNRSLDHSHLKLQRRAVNQEEGGGSAAAATDAPTMILTDSSCELDEVLRGTVRISRMCPGVASPAWTPARHSRSSNELQAQVMTALLSQRRLAVLSRAAAAAGGARKQRRVHLGTLTPRFLIHRVLCYISGVRPVVLTTTKVIDTDRRGGKVVRHAPIYGRIQVSKETFRYYPNPAIQVSWPAVRQS